MDTGFLENLEHDSQYMPDELLAELRAFREFEEAEITHICVLCTDKRLKINMDKYFDAYPEVNLSIFGTYEEDLTEAKKAARYCDAIIINTLALKIAPAPLCEVLGAIDGLNKKGYVILSGWESLPKQEDVIKSRAKQVDSSFGYIAVSRIRNAYDSQIEGFEPFEDILTSYIEAIMSVRDMLHDEQTESIYRTIYKDIKSFRRDIEDKVEQDIGEIQNIRRIISDKETKHNIVFSNDISAVIAKVADELELSVSNINTSDVLYELHEEIPDIKNELYDNEDEVIDRVKDIVKQSFVSKLEEQNDRYVSMAETEIVSRFADSKRELNDVVKRAGHLKYVKLCAEEALEALYESIEDDTLSGQFSNRLIESVKELEAHALDVLPKKMFAYDFDADNTCLLEELKFKAGEIIKKISDMYNEKPGEDGEADTDEVDEADETEDENGDSCSTDDEAGQAAEEKRQRYEKLKRDISGLVQYSKNQLASIVYDKTEAIKRTDRVIVKGLVKKYYESIFRHIDEIENKLKQIYG